MLAMGEAGMNPVAATGKIKRSANRGFGLPADVRPSPILGFIRQNPLIITDTNCA
jgi:hypothetical protein